MRPDDRIRLQHVAGALEAAMSLQLSRSRRPTCWTRLLSPGETPWHIANRSMPLLHDGTARPFQHEPGNDPMTDVRDSNGTKLSDGDSVTLIKDLKVRGTSVTLKRGTLVKNIRLTDDPAEIECNAEKVKGLVLRTEFLKKA
jgi:protein PhnA